MTRVSTSGNFGVMTSNLMRAQVLQNVAGEQVSSQKNASDLKGYAKNAEVLTAMKTAQAKVAGFLDQTTLVSNRLDVQDIGIGQVSDATQDARDAIANAIAAGSAETLMQQMGGAFGDVVQALNSMVNGRYVSAGAKWGAVGPVIGSAVGVFLCQVVANWIYVQRAQRAMPT